MFTYFYVFPQCIELTNQFSLHIAHMFIFRALGVTLNPWRKISPLKKSNENGEI